MFITPYGTVSSVLARSLVVSIAKMVRGPNQTSFQPGTTSGAQTRFSTGRQPATRNKFPTKYGAPMTPEQRKKSEADRMAISRIVQRENKEVFAEAAKEERRNISAQNRKRALDRRITSSEPAFSPDASKRQDVAKALVLLLR